MTDSGVTTLATCQTRADQSLARVLASPGFSSAVAKPVVDGVTVKVIILAGAFARTRGDVIELDASGVDDIDDDRLDAIIGHEMMHLVVMRIDRSKIVPVTPMSGELG